MASHNELTQQYGTYSNIFNYYAVFEPILASIAVKSNNTELGRAICSKYDNHQGDEVTIKAYCVDYDTKFIGWEVNGEIISRENPYTFTVTNEASNPEETTIYTAVFENGYEFHRIRNYVTKNYLNAISDEGDLAILVSGGDISSLELKTSDLNQVMYEAGSIVDIHYARIPNDTRYYYDYFVQGAKASKYYDFDPDDPTSSTSGVFLRMPFDAKTYTNTWAFATANEGGFRFTDSNGVPKITMGERPESQWYIECIDKDLVTKENYFSLDPEKLVQVGDKYYTTLRTSWNILFNPEQMTPYVVTSVDETEGTFEMEPITGNIIPAGTPVIIETKSSDIEENRMVPTKTAAANGAVPAGNLLKYSEKYFPNQPAPVSNCKQLMVKDGLLTFGGDALSSVNGNEAYISVSNDVSRIQKVTLAKLVAEGVPGRNYAITDLIGIAEVSDKANHDHMIICKDSNGYAAKDVKTDNGWIDYIHEVSELNVPETYDQSNWIALHLPTEAQISTDILKGAPLKGVKGRLISKENPEFMLDAVPALDGDKDKVEFIANTYIAASFYGDNHQPGYGGEKQFFFVQPKPMEYAAVTWSQWDGEKFVVPNSEDHPEWNQAGLKGQFDYNGNYLEQESVELLDGHTYKMSAVVKYKTATGGTQARAPRRAEGASKEYVVYPLTITRITDEQNGVITGVQQLSGDRQVMHVDYYNVSGMRSERPWQGVNIVVTRYSDGTTSAVKMLR